MNISSIQLYLIKMPLKSPFITHLGVVGEREGIIVEIIDHDGICGYGEGVAFSSPWYTEETVETSFHMLNDFLIPLLQNQPIQHPKEATMLFQSIRRNNMAKSALETALWDLYSKQNQASLSKMLGGKKERIPSGVVVATNSVTKALSQIEHYLEEGYQRFKIKIHPGQDVSLLAEIRRYYPDIPLMADANSSYTIKDIEQLKSLDQFNLLMIEQPLGHDDLIEHGILQKEIMTPICLDESIVTFDDARKAIDYGCCKVINVKVGRVGGLYEAKRIHDYCFEKDIEVWCGGMIEFGISRAHNIALASLPGFSIPGDISASNRFWEEDIILPEVTVENGWVNVPSGIGIGFEINPKRLKETMVSKRKYVF
ncbi:MAG: o-succinylbenzoate synthase [Bacillota bacterium]|nr:o-succinylbenzoate synthase [Bacillota bacterium]